MFPPGLARDATSPGARPSSGQVFIGWLALNRLREALALLLEVLLTVAFVARRY
jgi:hypothetical protein